MASADIEYRVLVTYASGGTLLGDLDKAHGHATKLGHALHQSVDAARELGGELVHGFQHAVEHAAHLAGHLAKMGLAAGIGAAAYGVGHLNNELEQTQISLAAIFKAQGFSRTFDMAFTSAGDQMSKMKQDIKTLPGDLGQLSNVMLQLASPLANAGKGPDAIREMAGKTMLASQILLGAKYGAGAQEIGAREMTMLLQGNMSSRNSFAQELPGMQQYKGQWKQMSEEKRLQIVSSKIDGLVKDAGGKFATSFVAGFTTLKDNAKYGFLAPATAPLFGAVKKTMEDINGWFDANKERVERWADSIGLYLQYAWERGIVFAEEWWPKILQFAKDIGRELSSVWTKAEPVVAHIAEHLKGALGNGSALKNLEHILELYAATKVALPALGTGMQMITPMMSMAGAMGEGGALAGIGAAAAPALAVVAVGALAVAGALDMLSDSTNVYHGIESEMADEIKGNLQGVWRNLTATAENLKPQFQTTIDMLGLFATGLADSTSDMAHNLGAATEYISKYSQYFPGLIQGISYLQGLVLKPDGPMGEVERTQELHFGRAMSTSNINELYKEMYAKKAKAGGGAGVGMHVQKVEIVVNSNQDAGRVAEMVVDKLQNLSRHPKLSQHVPNYSKVSK